MFPRFPWYTGPKRYQGCTKSFFFFNREKNAEKIVSLTEGTKLGHVRGSLSEEKCVGSQTLVLRRRNLPHLFRNRGQWRTAVPF